MEKKAEDFPYGAVRLTDPYLSHAIALELAYLRSLKPDRLLAGFLETAGLPAKGERYPGWEVTEIQGHTLGHYLTAVSQAFAYTGEKDLSDRLAYMTEELGTCQRKDGYLFAWKDEIFDRVEQKKPAWVPWYTMHKILGGLLSVYKFTQNIKAYEIAVKLGMWIYRRVKGWTEETRSIVLSVEYGGMNDCLYELYRVSGDPCFLEAAAQFDEWTLFQPIHDGRDILNGRHANTTIPKILGAARRYEILGEAERFYLETAEGFWDMVVEHHSYITGGNSEWEHFGKPDILDGERTACNCETCNTYNMLKLSKLLYELTGKRKYIDYYANTSLNAILSSQNPETGMTMYFQPMATGYFKVYGTPYESFWCCTGSGMENFTKLSEGIYYYNKNQLFITRYVSSVLSWKEKGLELRLACQQEEDTYKVKVCIEKAEGFGEKTDIHMLIPHWAGGIGTVVQNGSRLDAPSLINEETQEIIIQSLCQRGDEIELVFPMKLKAQGLPDNPNAIAFQYGPYVLSAGLGSVMMDTVYTGVQVLVPEKEIMVRDYFVLDTMEVKEMKEHPEKYLKKEKGEIAFRFKNLGQVYRFTPHYERHGERYGIYWLICEKNSKKLNDMKEKEERRQKLKRLRTDLIPLGNDQYELAHKIQGEETDSEQVEGHSCRFCKDKGWFSYEMKTGEAPRKLCMTVWGGDRGSRFAVYAGQILLGEVLVEPQENAFYPVELEIPLEAVPADQRVRIVFKSKEGICRIFDELYMKNLEKEENEEIV